MTTPAKTAEGNRVRPDIQALRAIAVLGVIVYHLYPNRLSGGFVGVDVFFVVSGFLITAHLLREVEKSGRINLPKFWSRRARRLLPASLLAIAVSAVSVWIWVPKHRWPQFGDELLASTFYFENWELARQAVDYSALSNAASPVQHFWSLGVEEQYYIVWPVLLLITALIAARLRVGKANAIALVMLLVGIASLVYSVTYTASDAGRAYFVTPTRVWEFVIGGLAAWWLANRGQPRLSRNSSTALTVAGLVTIAATMLIYDSETPFPSWTAAIPALGTVAIILADAPRHKAWPTSIMSLRPVQFVGDVSYGAYLWHWPMLILLPYVTMHQLTTLDKVSILVATFLVAYLSTRFVEDPIRRAGLRARRPILETVLGVAVLTIIIGASSHQISQWKPSPVEATNDTCLGAAAIDDPSCGDPEKKELIASVSDFGQDQPPEEIYGCETPDGEEDARDCRFGEGDREVVLLGDSHATRLVEPIKEITAARGYTLRTQIVAGCPMVSSKPVEAAWGVDGLPRSAADCQETTERTLNSIEADPHVDVVVLNNRTRLYLGEDNPDSLEPEEVEQTVSRLQAAGKRVAVLRDPPEMQEHSTLDAQTAVDCLSLNGGPDECSLDRQDARFMDPMWIAANATGADYLDMDDQFCTEDKCLSQIGGLVVYTDSSHLARTFAKTLEPKIDQLLEPVLTGGPRVESPAE